MKTRIQHPEHTIQNEAVCPFARPGAGMRSASGTMTNSGRRTGKRTGFSRLETAFSHVGPDKSTQVVDFPRLAHVGQAVLGTNIAEAERKPQRHGGTERGAKKSGLGNGVVSKMECWSAGSEGNRRWRMRELMRNKLRIIARSFTKMRESSHRSGP